MTYLLDHSEGLTALSTNARRITSCKVFHNTRDLPNPFDAPLFKEA